jgi:uncharacterized protein YlbG (UPF0298 family)
MLVHGFKVDSKHKKVPDYVLLALDKDMVKTMMNKLTYTKYIKWKLKILKKVLVDRIETNDYSEDAVTRINFTCRSIEHCEGIIND